MRKVTPILAVLLFLLSTLATVTNTAMGQPTAEPETYLTVPAGNQIVLMLDVPAPFSGLLMDEERAAWFADLVIQFSSTHTELTLIRKLSDEQSATITVMQAEIDKSRRPLNRPGALFAIGATTGAVAVIAIVLALTLGAGL